MKNKFALLLTTLPVLMSCHQQASMDETSVAPGAPGIESVWAYSGKTGIGTSYEEYVEGKYNGDAPTGAVSKVWFSLAEGIITETMFGLIHEAQLKEMQFYIQGDGFLDEERIDTVSTVEYLHTDRKGRPLSLAYKVTNRDKEGLYQIEKHIFTDPDRNSLMIKVFFHAFADKVTPYLYLNPHVANTGNNDKAWVDQGIWYAEDEGTALALTTDAPVNKSSVGFVGTSDGITALARNGQLTQQYITTGEERGNVAITLQLPTLSQQGAEWQFVIGFGDKPQQSAEVAQATLKQGSSQLLARFNGEGEAVGWRDYLATLPELERLSATATDGGKLLYASALVLKAQEDKTHAGALIASLSNPWGDSTFADEPKTGYKAVWPRDFYQVAMAMLALGDTATPKVAFEYLQKVQVTDSTPGSLGAGGWFLQKTEVDGTLEWVAVQLDQTAMPVMLGWRLWQEGVLTEQEAIHWYTQMLKPAADFLVDGGKVNLDWNQAEIAPPYTQQERWEEQSGYSPSTMAAVVAGLVSAADLATLADDTSSAERYLAAADQYASQIEAVTFTTQGVLNQSPNDGRYFLRISQNTDPDDQGKLNDANGQGALNESEIIDGGFLELVRYGVRAADDPHVVESLPELDNTDLPDALQVKYEFTFPGVEGVFPGWRRYGNDGYGENAVTGRAYGYGGEMAPGQRGRVWPFFTGERGHYELARARKKGEIDQSHLNYLRHTYVQAMELFANPGLMLPEQVWDGVGNNDVYQYTIGQGTNSATPLAWTHAEYIKLLRSLSDQQVWDRYPLVEQRYVDQ